MDVGLQRLSDHATLLELFVVGLEAPKPTAFDQVYALGFYVPKPLYKLGHAITKAVVDDRPDGADRATQRNWIQFCTALSGFDRLWECPAPSAWHEHAQRVGIAVNSMSSRGKLASREPEATFSATGGKMPELATEVRVTAREEHRK